MGIGYKSDNKINFTPPPQLIKLNDLPIPNYEMMETNLKFDIINMYFSRGCNSKCLYCNEKSFFPGYSMKSPQRIIDEITYYKEKGFEKFEVIDQSFNNSPQVLNEIVERIIENNFKIEWGGNAESYRMSESLLMKSIKSGLTHCYYGIESGSKKVLDLMKKPVNLDQAIKLMKLGKEKELKHYIYIIVGFPGETNDDFLKTKEFLVNNKQLFEDSLISVFSLLNGSEMTNNELIKPIQLEPSILNAFTYESLDGITHEVRKQRYLKLKELNLNR